MRLGHRVDHRDLALEQRIEPPLLLLVRAEHGEHVRLAAARRPRPGREDVGRPVRAADHLVQEGQVHLAEALPTLLGRQVGGVELLVLHLLAPLLEELSDRALWPTDVDHVVEQRLDRLDLLGHEAIGPIESRLHVGVGAEVPCHRQILPDHMCCHRCCHRQQPGEEAGPADAVVSTTPGRKPAQRSSSALSGRPEDEWELHRDQDELLYLISGATDVVLRDDPDDASTERIITLHGGEACIVPRGAWHRQVVHERSRLLFLSPDSVHRAYVPSDGWDGGATG